LRGRKLFTGLTAFGEKRKRHRKRGPNIWRCGKQVRGDSVRLKEVSSAKKEKLITPRRSPTMWIPSDRKGSIVSLEG